MRLGEEELHLPTFCVRCGADAVAVFYFSQGCRCSPRTVQPLCMQHAIKAGPAGNGSMELIHDLSVGAAFTREFWTLWMRHQTNPSKR